MYHLLMLPQLPILQQLQLEEALLRADHRNWCIVNTGSPDAIVMGISGKPEKLLNQETVRRDKIPVIKRFSGGGTVFIDKETVFVTLICNAKDSTIFPQPRPILEWTETLYRSVFPSFTLRENDYVFGEKKFGGNAQYIQKDRWLHHTSFLWDYDPAKMKHLLLPEKRPVYRADRSHDEFLCTLKPLFPKKEILIETLSRFFIKNLNALEMNVVDVVEILDRPHRKSTLQIEI